MIQRLHLLWLSTVPALLAMLAAQALDADLLVRLLLQGTALALAWRAATERAGRLQPIAFYLPISGLYVLAAMVEITLFGNRLNLEGPLMAWLADIGILFLVCVAFGHDLVAGAIDRTMPRPPGRLAPGTARAATIACGLMLALSAGMTLQRYGLAIGSVSRADLYAEEYTALSLVRGMLSMALAAAAALIATEERQHDAHAVPRRGTLLAMLTIYMLIDLAVLGDRRLPVIAGLGVALAFAPRRISPVRIAAVASTLVMLVLYGFVRNTPPSEWLSTFASGDVLGGISPAANEFGGLAIIGGAIGDFGKIPADFPTYGDAFLQILPRALLANRPESPTEWFIWTYFPALAEIGASFAFNAVIEALANAGLAGVVGGGLVTGALIAALSRWRVHGAAIGVPAAAYVFLFSMRMDLASQLRTVMVAAIGIATMWGLAGLLLAISRAASQQEPAGELA